MQEKILVLTVLLLSAGSCLAMYSGWAVRGRRGHGRVESPESFLGRSPTKSHENPASRITPAGGYWSSNNGVSPKKSPTFLRIQ